MGTKESKKPNGEVRQVSYVKDEKVSGMLTAESYLNIIQDRGKRKLPLDDVYRQLYNPDMYLKAYAKLYQNEGAMTPGMTEETVDGMSQEKMAKIIAAIRYERCRWTPVRRVEIPQRNGKMRPLGMPALEDNIVAKAVAMLLEAIDEQDCCDCSDGFRSGRSPHHALHAVRQG